MEFLNHIISMLEGFSSTQAFLIVGTMLEFLLRMIKSEKPLGVIHMVAAFCSKLGDVFKKIAEVMDKVLPQRLK